MIDRVSIRLRLTIAFAGAMTVLLAAAGLLTYLQVRSELDETIAGSLQARIDTLAAAAVARDPELPASSLDPDEGFAQIVAVDGEVIAATGGPPAAALEPGLLAAATREPLSVIADVPGVEGATRILAAPAPGGIRVVIAGQSLEDRDETLSGLLGAFAIGGPIGIVAASLLGYLLAAAGLRPVEAMRRRAESISLDQPTELPLPSAEDEIRRLGVTLNEMLDRLRRAFERERRFVADASHEIRTPVSVLKTEIESASRSADLPADVRESLNAALEECDQLAQLAEDLLLIARSGEAGIELDRRRVEVPELLRRVRERFVLRAESAAREIAVDAPAGLVLEADSQRLGQALGNLVDNALRHGEGEIVLGARLRTDVLELFVRDQGSGFPADIVTRAFERFSRGDAARTRGGAGLGLAIVAEIAKAHSGGVEVADSASTEVRISIAPPH